MTETSLKTIVSFAIAIIAVSLLVVAGCQTGSGDRTGWPSFRYRNCSADAPCPAEFSCTSGHCVSDDSRFVMTTTSCESGADCGYGMACVKSACVVDVLDCVSDFDCVGNRVCVRGSCIDESRCINREDQPCDELERSSD